jgi:hypothetical protein
MSEWRVERRLAASLAADVTGYSRLMGEDEARTFAEISYGGGTMGEVRLDASETPRLVRECRQLTTPTASCSRDTRFSVAHAGQWHDPGIDTALEIGANLPNNKK